MPAVHETKRAPEVLRREDAAPAGNRPGYSEADPSRPRVAGKFLFAGERKLYVRGVTYGPFRPDAHGSEYHDRITVERDFAQMEAIGINAVRTYTIPPEWLLEIAQEHRIGVLIGWPWEQHVAFLDSRKRERDLRKRIRGAVRALAGHPGILAYALGNEIPAPLVRWYGHERIERFLERIYWTAKEEDPEGLFTYVNYPSTEYLELPFLDFVSFNVYLENQERLQAYAARLQNIAGERPLVMAELGLDSGRNGQSAQACSLEWQIRTLFSSGCAGLFVFAWTDEWHQGGHEILDWKFGLSTTERTPKPAMEAVRQAFQHVPFEAGESWPLVSVIVCSYNGARTIRQALEAVRRLRYPNFETIVVDDGSTDATAAISSEYEIRVIRVANGGLSAARNLGWQAAKGEIVAFLDDDAAPDPHWLHYLASALLSGKYTGVGGPNIGFYEDGFAAQCIDHAPGNPTHVLVTDQEAEHLPGCNMAYRRARLEAVGGFDPQFRIAGDDVDLCWRLQQRGWKLGFHPGAMVWHHRRNSIRSYWRQQMNYGRAEAMLERKWPEKYNAAGHLTWNGRLYGKGLWQMFAWSQRRIYHGSWGSALFQSVYSAGPGKLSTLLMMPEWYLIVALVMLISLFGIVYPPFRFAAVLLVAALVPPSSHAVLSGGKAFFRIDPRQWARHWRFAAMTALLHFLQPAARLTGRFKQGLTPWRRRGTDRMIAPRSRKVTIWSQTHWKSAEQRLEQLESIMRKSGAVVLRGGDYDRWDLEVRGGMLGTARLQLLLEEHGEGRQLVRLRIWPTVLPTAPVLAALFALLAMFAVMDLSWITWGLLDAAALALMARTFYESGTASAVMANAIPAAIAEGETIVRAGDTGLQLSQDERTGNKR